MSASVAVPCAECGAVARPKSDRIPELCVRCGDGQGHPADEVKPKTWFIRGAYDGPLPADGYGQKWRRGLATRVPREE